jgi:anti-anti-sigma factor
MHGPFCDRSSESAVEITVLESHLCDARAQLLGDQLDEVAGTPGQRNLRLDLARVEGLASTAMGQIVSLHHRTADLGGHLEVVNLAPDLYALFRLTRLDRFLDVRMARQFGPVRAAL